MTSLAEFNKTDESFEDDDDEGFVSFGNNRIPSYEIELDVSIREKVKKIIFSEGIQATEFAKNYIALSTSESIGKLVKKIHSDKSDIELLGLQYREPEPSLFFLINQETLLCTCSPTLSSEDCYPFAKSVISSFNSNVTALILTVSALSGYKSENHASAVESPLLRTLSSTHSFGLMKIPKLEQPNILGGVAAGILTVCDIKEYPAIACVVFSSSLNLDADMVEGFTNFLHSIEATRLLDINKIGRFPKSINTHAKTGNLYI